MKKQNRKVEKTHRKKRILTKRNGIILIVLLAALILAVNIFTVSYSWFAPEVQKGTGMQYTADLTVRSENCTISTVVLNSSGIYVTPDSSTVTIDANSIQYFKTTVYNADTNPTNISLYISALPAAANAYGLGVAHPTNTFRKFTEATAHPYILRNAYVKGKIGENAGERVIEWFIKTSGTAVTIELSNLYLMYN